MWNAISFVQDFNLFPRLYFLRSCLLNQNALYICIQKVVQSNDKAVVKATFEEVNSKIKTRGISNIKPL